MSSVEEKPHDGFPQKKSSDSVKDVGAPGEKASVEHAAVDASPTAQAEQVPTVGFTELFRCAFSSITFSFSPD